MKQNGVCESPRVRRKVTFGAKGSHQVREQQRGRDRSNVPSGKSRQ
jgi:hypothetical protein